MPEEVTSSSGARAGGPSSDPAPASVCPSVPTTPSPGVSTPCLTATTVHANQAQQCAISMVTEHWQQSRWHFVIYFRYVASQEYLNIIVWHSYTVNATYKL